MMRRFTLVPALLLGLVVAGQSHAATVYKVIGIPPVGPGTSLSSMNESGQIVGSSSAADGTRQAFIYDHGTVTYLGSLLGGDMYGMGINAVGQVTGVGLSPDNSVQHAYLYSAGSLIDLGTLRVDESEGYDESGGYAVNDRGQVSGFASTGSGHHAFLYSGGVMHDLGDFGEDEGSGNDVNEAGQVAGFSALHNDSHAFLYSGGVMHDLGTLGGFNSTATAIDELGNVVGYAQYDWLSAAYHAFLYSGGSMLDLGTLGGDSSFAADINDIGQIIGNSNTTSSSLHAFLYSDGVMRDLNDLIAPSFQADWTLTSAISINNKGEILGSGIHDGVGANFLLVALPLPEPGDWGMMFAGFAAIGGMQRRRRKLRA